MQGSFLSGVQELVKLSCFRLLCITDGHLTRRLKFFMYILHVRWSPWLDSQSGIIPYGSQWWGSHVWGSPILCCLMGKATRYLTVVERVQVKVEICLKVRLCQIPQVFPSVGQHRRRQSTGGRGVWSKKHSGKSPTRQWRCLVRRDPIPLSCVMFSPMNSSWQRHNPQ